MSHKLTYYGRVDESGKIDLPKRARTEIGKVFAGKHVTVLIERKRKTRSSQQNAYYWACVIPMVVQGFIDMGNDLVLGNPNDHDLVHDFLKEKLLRNGRQLVDIHAQVHETPASTTRCTTVEFMEYVDKVVQFAAEMLNVTIPPPNTQTELW